MNTLIKILLLSILFVGCKTHSSSVNNNLPSTNDTFAKGADISWVTQMESAGNNFYKDNNLPQDCFVLLKNKGINAIRLRAWVNPTDGWCNTTDLVAKSIRANNEGQKIMIDFHYSDGWADPGKQNKPAAWKNISGTDLINIVHTYTLHVMDTLKQNGIVPTWVQVGNETNDGMLWEDGRASTHFNYFSQLINSGYSAVKSSAAAAKVIVHLSNGYDNNLFRWMFDSLTYYHTNYDVIGMSLYPETYNWQTVDNDCLTNMNDMVLRYGKQIMICEVGMSAADPINTNAFLTDIIAKIKLVPNQMGLGIFYWEPECYNWQNYSKGAFDNTGKPTIALDAFGN